MTPAEKFLWEKVRKRNFIGLRFNRQYAINYKLLDSTDNWFIADFYCHEKRLIIEVDGPIHEARKEYDLERGQTLTYLGFRIIRFSNYDILNNWDEVEIQLINFIKDLA